MARVELHTNCKVVNVDKTKLVLVDGNGGTLGPVVSDTRGASDFAAPRPMATPKRYGDGAMTPRHYSDGSRTPRHLASGAQTPAWGMNNRTPNPYSSDNSRSSAWDAGAKTPNPYASSSYADGSKTPAWDSGSKTPSWKAETPRWSSSGGRTPGYNDYGNKSPTWSSRYDDRETAPTPAPHTLAPSTPAVSVLGSFKHLESLFKCTFVIRHHPIMLHHHQHPIHKLLELTIHKHPTTAHLHLMMAHLLQV